MTTSVAIRSPETATPPAFHSGSGRRLPTERASTASDSRASCASGGARRAPSPPLLAGSMRKARPAKASVTGTTDQKAARHAPSSANTPPTAGPISVATPHMADVSAMARGHSGSAKTMRIIA